MNVLLVGINAKYIHSNIAIRQLKNYAENAGAVADIELLEMTVNNYAEDILAEIFDKNPDFVGFSCYIWNISIVRKLVVMLKILLPYVKILLGGPEVSFRAEENFSLPIDYFISGEGERAFALLLSNICNNAPPLSEIEGLSYRHNSDICSNPQGSSLPLSELSFPYENFDGLEHRILYYEASRGCPFSCKYCLSSANRGVRFAPISKVKRELQIFLDKKVRQVKFVDRTFNANDNFAAEIISYLIENDNGITNFHFEMESTLLTDALLTLLCSARKGLFQLEIGVQSTNAETLSAIGRKGDFEWLERCVKKLKSNENIHIHLDLIAGLPLEDYESFLRSLDAVYALQPHQLQLGFLKLLKGSGMEEICDRFEIKSSPFPPYEVLSTNCLDYKDVLRLKNIEEMVEVYYNTNHFRYTIRYIRELFTSFSALCEALCHYKNETHTSSLLTQKHFPFEFLLNFAREKFTEKVVERVRWLLLFDMILRDNLRTIPEFLGIQISAAARERGYFFLTKNAGIRKLLPEYSDADEKQLPKLTQVTEFPFDPRDSGAGAVTLLFNYRNRDIWGNAAVIDVV